MFLLSVSGVGHTKNMGDQECERAHAHKPTTYTPKIET